MADLTSRLLVVISASAGGAVKELDSLESSAAKTGTAFDSIGKRAGLAGATIKAGLVAGAAAFVGTGLVTYLNDSVAAYSDSAKAAGELATATGGTVQEVSRLQAALEDSGISAEQSAGLLTKFTTNAGKYQETLSSLGVELKRNADGSIDYTDALVRTVDAISKVGDSSRRNQLLVQFFGKQGAAAFNELRASGVSLADSMRAVSTARVFNTSDVKAAYEYDSAIDQMNASFKQLQFVVGRDLVPALSIAVSGLATVLDVVTAVPGPVAAGVAAFAALRVAMQSTLVAGLVEQFGTALAKMATALTIVATGGADASVMLGKLKAGVAGLAATAGPLALVAGAVYAVTAALQSAKAVREYAVDVDTTTRSLRDQAVQLNKTDSVWRTLVVNSNVQRSMESITVALRGQAEATLDAADATELEKRRAQELLDVLGDGTVEQQTNNLATEKGRQAQENYAKSLSATEVALKTAQDAQRGLSDLITEGVTSGSEFDAALRSAGDAAQKTARDQEILNAALVAYNGATSEAIEATEGFYTALYSAEEAAQRARDAVAAYNAEGTKDTLQAVIDTTRAAADAAVAQWEAAQRRLGLYVSESERAAQRVSAIEVLLRTPGFPPGAASALQTEAASIVAAATRETGFRIPVGFDAADIDTALATITAKLADPGISPELRAQLLLDQQSLQTTKANIDNLGVDAATEVRVDADTAPAQSSIDGLTAPKTANVTVTTTYDGTGYSGAKARADYLAQSRTATLVVAHSFSPDGYNAVKSRTDYLAQARTATIVNDVVFGPDGYLAAKARKDYLAQDRTATITQVVRRVNASGGAEAQAVGRSIPNLYANVQPTNIFKVAIDGQPLRAWIRSEVAAAQPTPMAVA